VTLWIVSATGGRIAARPGEARPVAPRALWAVLCALLLAACGRAGDRDDARAAAERLYAAVASRDGETACAQLSAQARETLEQEEERPCAEAVLSLQLEGRAATDARVYVTTATVRFDSGQRATVDDTAEGWRVSAAGCSGGTADKPHTCELEA
jgi:hypothetical protein